MILSGLDAVGRLGSNSLFTVRLASEVFATVECGIIFQTFSAIMETITSLVTVTAINFERYTAVVHPMCHCTQMKKACCLSLLYYF